jgi:hypothetical protein
MQNITPEQIYSEFHRQRVKLSKGVYPRSIKNWEKIRKKPEWVSFQKLANMVNRNRGHIYFPLMIKAVLYFHRNKRMNFNRLFSQAGIKFYRNFINLLNLTKSKTEMEKIVIKNFEFILKYMNANNIRSFREYLNEGVSGIPTVAIHYYSGAISIFCLIAIPNILNKIDSYPMSIQMEYFQDFKEKYKEKKDFVLKSKVVRQIISALEKKL